MTIEPGGQMPFVVFAGRLECLARTVHVQQCEMEGEPAGQG